MSARARGFESHPLRWTDFRSADDNYIVLLMFRHRYLCRSTQEAEGTPLERVQVVNSGARVQIPPSALKADIIRRIRMVSVFFCFHKKLCPMKQKRSARNAMGWKRILSQKQPAAGREACERISFLLLGSASWERRACREVFFFVCGKEFIEEIFGDFCGSNWKKAVESFFS